VKIKACPMEKECRCYVVQNISTMRKYLLKLRTKYFSYEENHVLFTHRKVNAPERMLQDSRQVTPNLNL